MPNIATKKEFTKAWNAYKQEAWPGPAHTCPQDRLSDKDESSLKKMIRNYCKMQGFLFTSYDAKGFHNGKHWIQSKNDKGRGDGMIQVAVKCGDLTLCHTIWLDIKIGRDYQKDHQKKFQESVEAIGGDYILPRNWEDFIRQMNPILERLPLV